jgi:hypothetical protein
MVEFSLWEKIKTTFNLIFSSPLFLILLIGFALMFADYFFISKKSKKVKIIYLSLSLIMIILLLQNYFDSLFNVFDIIAKNIVAIVYFPSVLEYILMLLISLIIILFSLFNKDINKKIKVINLSTFFVNNFLFFMILDEISKKNIDLSNKISIYSNENLMVLFELSMGIFIIWVVGLLLYKIINKIIHKNDAKNNAVNTIMDNFYEEPELPKTIEELRKEELILEPKIEYVVVEKDKEDMFTLDEYKELRKLLEQIKNNKKEN